MANSVAEYYQNMKHAELIEKFAAVQEQFQNDASLCQLLDDKITLIKTAQVNGELEEKEPADLLSFGVYLVNKDVMEKRAEYYTAVQNRVAEVLAHNGITDMEEFSKVASVDEQKAIGREIYHMLKANGEVE